MNRAQAHAIVQRRGQQPHGGSLAGSSANPVPHGKLAQPAVGLSVFVQLAPNAGYGHRVRPELQAVAFPRGRGFQHAVACFLGAAALADYHSEGFSHSPFQLRQHLVHAIRIGVIEEIRAKAVGARLAQRIGHELRAEGGAANADDQQILERTGRALDPRQLSLE